MAKAKHAPLIPWANRWATPSADELWAPHKEAHQKALKSFFEGALGFDGMEQALAWHGEGWMWTFEITLAKANLGGQSAGQDAFAYIVPRPEFPEVVIPLSEAFLEIVPMRRLNRFIRDAIKSSKQSVDMHWTTWAPSAQTEVDHLLDLVKRKHKHLTVA